MQVGSVIIHKSDYINSINKQHESHYNLITGAKYLTDDEKIELLKANEKIRKKRIKSVNRLYKDGADVDNFFKQILEEKNKP